LSIKIDGVNFNFQDGMTILQVINAFKIEHPQICYLPEVDPIETCDTCIVEVNGSL
jgi:formate dehydrogenase major subunit